MDPVYIVLEIKTVEHDGGYAVITSNTQHSTRQSAESQYYTKLAAAANPDNPNLKRAVVLMANDGFPIEYKSYAIQEPEPEPEPESPETPSDATDGINAQGGESNGPDGATDV